MNAALIPGLALALICRDEAPVIRRALESVRSYCDPLIVVDTGSTDGTQQIAEELGARVVSFCWRDDFSGAKNFALDEARRAGARYALVLDADEHVTGGWETLRSWIAQAPAALGCVRIANATDNGIGAVFTVARVIPLEGGAWAYHGKIHENPRGPGEPSAALLEVHHTGYTSAEIARKNKPARVALMRAELAELAAADPRRAYLHYQIARSLGQGGSLGRPRPTTAGPPELDEAHPLYHLCQAARLAEPSAPWLSLLTRDLALVLSRCRRRGDAIRLLWTALARWPDFTDLLYLEGVILSEVLEPETDAGARSALLRALELGDAPSDRYIATPGAGSYLARYQLGRLAERAGDLAEARSCYQIAAPHYPPAALALDRLAPRPPPEEHGQAAAC